MFVEVVVLLQRSVQGFVLIFFVSLFGLKHLLESWGCLDVQHMFLYTFHHTLGEISEYFGCHYKLVEFTRTISCWTETSLIVSSTDLSGRVKEVFTQ